jgi:hypothetical protein
MKRVVRPINHFRELWEAIVICGLCCSNFMRYSLLSFIPSQMNNNIFIPNKSILFPANHFIDCPLY